MTNSWAVFWCVPTRRFGLNRAHSQFIITNDSPAAAAKMYELKEIRTAHVVRMASNHHVTATDEAQSKLWRIRDSVLCLYFWRQSTAHTRNGHQVNVRSNRFAKFAHGRERDFCVRATHALRECNQLIKLFHNINYISFFSWLDERPLRRASDETKRNAIHKAQPHTHSHMERKKTRKNQQRTSSKGRKYVFFRFLGNKSQMRVSQTHILAAIIPFNISKSINFKMWRICMRAHSEARSPSSLTAVVVVVVWDLWAFVKSDAAAELKKKSCNNNGDDR